MLWTNAFPQVAMNSPELELSLDGVDGLELGKLLDDVSDDEVDKLLDDVSTRNRIEADILVKH